MKVIVHRSQTHMLLICDGVVENHVIYMKRDRKAMYESFKFFHKVLQFK